MKHITALLVFTFAAAPRALFAQILVMPKDSEDRPAVTDTIARTPALTIQSWPPRPRALARAMIAKYGAPSRFGEHALYWYDNGPWQKTTVYRDGLSRDFLLRSKDFMEQSVGYQVPADSVDDLKRFDARITVDAGARALSSRSDSEALNFLALNLAVQVITHARTADEARVAYRRMRRLAASGKSSSYLDGLAFEPQNDKDINHWNP